MKDTNHTTCVVVGRFQVDELHEGHIDFLNKVQNSYQKTIIFLGLSPIKCSKNNPLDFIARKQMILDKFPDITVLYIKDCYSNELWSDTLDSHIKNVTGIKDKVILLGNRDSFIKYYTGKYDTLELEQEIFISGTQIREKISNITKGVAYFRQGVIWATENQYPVCHPTIDVAIVKKVNGIPKVLLGKRNTEPLYRFIGGFVEPGETFETTALRETQEETGLEVDTPNYLESFVIDDWRYRNETNKITTSFFICKYMFGNPQPQDDIDELRWFDINDMLFDVIVYEHRLLVERLITEVQ